MKGILVCALKCLKDYKSDEIKKDARKRELEKDIINLEVEINLKLGHEDAKQFKNKSVIGKSVTELECLRAEMKANDARSKENSGLLIIKSFALSFVSILMIEYVMSFNEDFKNWIDRFAMMIIAIVLYSVLLFILLHVIKTDEKKNQEKIQHNTHLIELMDLLIRRKRELKDY